jgi:hypothetical protein
MQDLEGSNIACRNISTWIKEDQCVHIEPNAVEKLMLIPRPFTRGTVDFLPEEEDNWS